MRIDFSSYSLPDIYVLDQRPYFLDYVRNKFIMQQPEEEIRQRMIMFLVYEMKVPLSMIEVEVPLSSIIKLRVIEQILLCFLKMKKMKRNLCSLWNVKLKRLH